MALEEFTCQVSLVDTIVPLNKILKGEWPWKNLPVKFQWWTPLSGVVEHRVTQLIVWPQRRPNKQKLSLRLLRSHVRLHLINRTPWKIGVLHGNMAPTKVKCFTWLLSEKHASLLRDYREGSFTLHPGASYAVRKERQIVISFFTVNSPLSYGPCSQPNTDQMDYA